MPTLVLRQTIPAAQASAISALPAHKTRTRHGSLEGILLFSGLSLGLLVLAAIFSYLQLPSPVLL